MSCSRPTWRKEGLIGAGLMIAALAVYSGALGNAPVSDDVDLIVKNPFLAQPSGLVELVTGELWSASRVRSASEYYRPLPMVSFWAQALLAGLGVGWLRAGNVLLHAASAVLLRAAVRQRVPGLPGAVATLLALLWLALPLHSELSLWLSARFDLLAALFALSALVAARQSGWLGHGLVLASVAGGLLSKETFVPVVPLLVLDDVVAGRSRWELARRYGPVALGVAGYFGLRAHLGLAMGAAHVPGVSEAAVGFASLVVLYGRLLGWPDALDMMHRFVPLEASAAAAVLLALALAFVGSIWWSWRSGPARHAVLLGGAWIALTLAPSCIAGAAFGLVGDRYASLPAVGVFLWGAGVVSRAWPRLGRARARAAYACVGALVVCAGVVTVRRGAEWRDERTLARAALARDPDHHYWLYTLGMRELDAGRLEAAEPLLVRAAELDPVAWRYQNALCYVRLQQDRLLEALDHCRRSLADHAGNAATYTNLASIHVRRRDWARALEAARRATELRDGYVEALYLRAVSAANLSRFEEATQSLRAGLAEEPDHPRLVTLEREMRARGIIR